MIIYGVNPVLEALRAGRANQVIANSHAGPRVRDIARLASERGVSVQWVEPAHLDRVARGGAHQGVAAELAEAPRRSTLEDLVREAAAPALFVVLDGIEDPRNLGAILRTADAAGVDGVLRQSRHAAPLGGAAAKASAGALAHVRIAEVVNVARALGQLKEAGIWTVGLASDAATRYHEIDLTLPTAVVLGAEGRGLRRLVRERCDWLVSIPLCGRVASLNVSVAAGIALFEVVRQRSSRMVAGTGQSRRSPGDPDRR